MQSYQYSLLILLSFGLWANISFTAEHRGISWEQRKEMFLAGSFDVSDKDGNKRGEFQINYLPGASNINHDAQEHWGSAIKTVQVYLQGEEFWLKEIAGEITGNLTWGWETSGKYGIRAIPKDLQELAKDMQSVRISEFGAIGHYALDGLGMTASLVGRPIVSGLIWAGVGIKTLVATPVKLVWPAFWGTSESIVAGTAVPVLKYIWNGSAWVATQIHSEVPPEQDTVIVTWKSL